MPPPTCKLCGSTDVAWREGKQGGRYLIDTKRPHFCKKPKPLKRKAKPVVAFGRHTSEEDRRKLEAKIKEATDGKDR